MERGTEKKRTFADMITPEEYALLRTDEVREAIARARGRDPLEVATDRRVPHARLVATQVKYLARAERKLPSYAAAQCILPPLAFEQARARRAPPTNSSKATRCWTSPADWARTRSS